MLSCLQHRTASSKAHCCPVCSTAPLAQKNCCPACSIAPLSSKVRCCPVCSTGPLAQSTLLSCVQYRTAGSKVRCFPVCSTAPPAKKKGVVPPGGSHCKLNNCGYSIVRLSALSGVVQSVVNIARSTVHCFPVCRDIRLVRQAVLYCE